MDESESIELHRALDRARGIHHEDHAAALAEAVRCCEHARVLDHDGLRCRALVLQGAVALQRGDLRGAVRLTSEAAPLAERSGDDVARAELASVKAQLSFFAGSYPEAHAQADRGIALADGVGDLDLRLFARRCACVVFGNLGVPDLVEKIDETLRLAIEAKNPWEEALSRNDLAHSLMERGELAAAEREIGAALAVADQLAPRNRFALAGLNCTRSDIRLHAGRPAEALTDARHAVELLLGQAGDPNPYLLAMTVVVEVQALRALGRLDEAAQSGRRMVERLGDGVPQARGLILGTVAGALREAGRTEEAYDVLALSAEVERAAFQELAELRRGLERATLEADTARRLTDALAAKNRELEEVVRQLGEARERLREQAERDHLTGLHNRRYLARYATADGPFSLAVLDLDAFKTINDRFGHQAGDQVLMRVAALLLGGVRSHDIVVRTGGEEFLLLMPGTDASDATHACERLCDAIRAESWDQIAPGLTVTASVGVAAAEDVVDLDALSELADSRLYDAKRAGRDRVVA